MKSILNDLPKVPDSREMHLWDQAAHEFGLPLGLLMENAGRCAVEAIREQFGQITHAWIFMGNDNNGGDAAIAARHLLDAGAAVTIFLLDPVEKHEGMSGEALKMAIKNGATVKVLELEKMDQPDIFIKDFYNQSPSPSLLIDGLLGTGLATLLKPKVAKLINLVNSVAASMRMPVVALDVPSGLDSKSGKPLPIAIRADLTVAFEAPKPGLLMPGARTYTGALTVKKIGIPKTVLKDCQARYHLADGRALGLLPPIKCYGSYKNQWGHVTVIGGSQGHAGAAHLAAAAALRAGAGLVTAVAPGSSLNAIKSGWPEIMTLAASENGEWPDTPGEPVCRQIRQSSSVVIGPGMGINPQAARFAAAILAIPDRPPAIVDADCLRMLGLGQIECRLLSEMDIITPHPGEAGVLLGVSAREIQTDRMTALDKLCDMGTFTVALKGTCTLIGQKAAARALCPYDIPQLAIGGAGDVLAGALGALLGMHHEPRLDAFSLACLGVVMHAMAGLMLQQDYPRRGGLASGLADHLPDVFQFLAKAQDTDSVPWPNY